MGEAFFAQKCSGCIHLTKLLCQERYIEEIGWDTIDKLTAGRFHPDVCSVL